MSFLIDKIEASHFGGIRGTAALDLTAPLTVLYAPNGTGKTSLVEAINWVFEGECREPRCRLADWNDITEVTFQAQTKNGTAKFSKSISTDGTELRKVDGAVVSTVSTFLQALAPDCNVEGLNHRTQIARLTAHLSANRVLTIEALASVIDTSTAETRANAMADMLGTRMQHNAQKQLALYLARVRDLRRRYEERQLSLQGRQNELTPRVQSMEVDVSSLTADIVSALGLHSTQLPDQSVSTLKRLATEERARLQSDRAAYDDLNRILNIESPDISAEQFAMSLAAADSTIRSIQTRLETLASGRLDSSAKLNGARRSHKTVVQIVPLARQLALLVKSDPQTSRWLLKDIADECTRNDEAFDDPKGAKALLSTVEHGVDQWRTDLLRLSEITAAIAETDSKLKEFGSEGDLESELADLHSELDEEDRRLAGIHQLTAQLTSLAQQLVEHDSDQRNCPACKHDWGSHERLKLALQSAVTDGALDRDFFANRRAVVTGRIEETERLLRSRTALETRRRNAVQDRVATTSRIRDISEAAARFKFKSPDDVSLLSISAKRASLERSELAKKIYELISSDPDLKSLWSTSLSVSQHAENAAELARQKQEAIVDLERGIENAERDMASLQQKLTFEMSAHKRLDEQLSSARVRLSQLRELEQRFVIAPLTAEKALTVGQTLQQREMRLSFAEISIKTLERAVDGGYARADMDRIRTELNRLRKCIEMVVAEEERCERINTALSASIESHRRQLVSSIGPNVSQLFQRMQVNRVFSAVECSSDLQLSGVLAGEKYDPDVFSAGQKQDLALAFFLVRAHALGGSFFMDEPLAHLDDLNRVALLDTLRGFALSSENRPVKTRLLLTTASWNTARHIMEKFMRVDRGRNAPALRVYRMGGNVSTGTQVQQMYPLTRG